MTEPTDDFCITIAMLHGARIQSASACDGLPTQPDDLWYWHDMPHDIEDEHYQTTGYYGWQSRAALARAYCEYHKLI